MKRLSLILLILTLTGCGSITDYFTKPFTSLFSNDDDDDGGATTPTVTDEPVVESTAKYALAMGGVAPGRDQLVIDPAPTQELTFSTTSDIVGFLPLSGKTTFTEGSGAQIVPQKEGTTTVHYSEGGVENSTVYSVVIPPQSLIQILIGEARGQIADDVTLSNDAVALTSRSTTAEAIAWVVRNRVALIDSKNNPSLFKADATAYASGGDAAKYNAVISAISDGVYQFSPVDPSDDSHDEYQNAEARSFLDKSLYAAYDQSVLSAAFVFNGTLSDPTNGAFGFRTPTVDEGLCLDLAAQSSSPTLLASCDDPDARFPTLAPIQVLILPGVPRLSDGRPAFIFYRARTITEPAVTTTP